MNRRGQQTIAITFLGIACFVPAAAFSNEDRPTGSSMHQGMDHSDIGHDQVQGMNHDGAVANAMYRAPSEGGQAAFGALQEIVTILEENPQTDWSKVDIEALRRHLIDMDNVTLRSEVSVSLAGESVRFQATSEDPKVAASLRRMVSAHVKTMNGINQWALKAADIPKGATLTVTPADTDDVVKIKGLGFIGVMTVGAHHQSHHLAIASGTSPH